MAAAGRGTGPGLAYSATVCGALPVVNIGRRDLVACQFAPVLLLGAWAGLVADRSDKRKLLFGESRNGLVYGHTQVPLMRETWPSLQAPDGQRVLYAAPSFSKEDQESFFDARSALKPGKWMGVVHPGTGEPQRASVVELLCSPRAKEIIKLKNIQLVSYNDLWDEVYGKRASK